MRELLSERMGRRFLGHLAVLGAALAVSRVAGIPPAEATILRPEPEPAPVFTPRRPDGAPKITPEQRIRNSMPGYLWNFFDKLRSEGKVVTFYYPEGKQFNTTVAEPTGVKLHFVPTMEKSTVNFTQPWLKYGSNQSFHSMVVISGSEGVEGVWFARFEPKIDANNSSKKTGEDVWVFAAAEQSGEKLLTSDTKINEVIEWK